MRTCPLSPGPPPPRLLQGVMLRRSKSEVDAQLLLPPCQEVDVVVALGRVERTFYNSALEVFRGACRVGGRAAGGGGGGADAAAAAAALSFSVPADNSSDLLWLFH